MTRSDTNLLKGFAILLLIIHNFCHWLPVCALENEYKFYLKRTWVLVDFLSQGEHVILNLFSYFGHYGVPIFVLLSGYGLVKKYEHPSTQLQAIPKRNFILSHAIKLWTLLLPGLLLWFVSDLQLHSWKWTHHYHNVIHLLAFVGNLFPTQPFIIGPHWLRELTHQLPRQDLLMGPWWFFSLIMQLYLIYRLVFYKRGKAPLIILTVLSMLLLLHSVIIRDPHMDYLNFLRYNFVGSLLPFTLGIWMARYQFPLPKRFTPIWLLLGIICCFNKIAWLLTPLFFTLAALSIIHLKGLLRDVLEKIGQLSAVLFVVHPIIRAYFIKWIGNGANWYLSLAIYLFVTFLIAILYQHLLSKYLKPLSAKIFYFAR